MKNETATGSAVKIAAAVATAWAIGAATGTAGEVRKGMTEQQVIREVGKPKQISSVDGHLQWIYTHVRGREWNPFDFAAQIAGPEVLSLTFNSKGRVAHIEHDR